MTTKVKWKHTVSSATLSFGPDTTVRMSTNNGYGSLWFWTAHCPGHERSGYAKSHAAAMRAAEAAARKLLRGAK